MMLRSMSRCSSFQVMNQGGGGDHQISKINLPPHPAITSQAIEYLSSFSWWHLPICPALRSLQLHPFIPIATAISDITWWKESKDDNVVLWTDEPCQSASYHNLCGPMSHYFRKGSEISDQGGPGRYSTMVLIALNHKKEGRSMIMR